MKQTFWKFIKFYNQLVSLDYSCFSQDNALFVIKLYRIFIISIRVTTIIINNFIIRQVF